MSFVGFKGKNSTKIIDQYVKPENKILDILILGGGPVGLFVGYKLLKKGNRITVFEKRKEYTRHNIVGLQESKNLEILSLIPSEIMDELLKTCCYSSYDKTTKNKKYYKKYFKNEPYESFQDRVINMNINQFEIALEKYFELFGGIIIKPIEADSFSNIILQSDIIKYNDKNIESKIDISKFDIIIMNDGANSYFRNIFFNKTSYMDKLEDNVFYYGLDENYSNIKISNNKDDVKEFAFGLLMIHKIEDIQKFNNLFRSNSNLYGKQKYHKLFKIDNNKHEDFINGINFKNFSIKDHNILNENNSSLKSQNLFRMFASDDYMYVSIMINPKDMQEFLKNNTNTSIKFNDLTKILQTYVLFALYFYDLTELINPLSENNTFKIFPIIFSSVKESCSFINKDKKYQFMALLGDAMVSGNFHAGIVLNRNLLASNYLCQLIDEYIESYPKNNNNELDNDFLKLLFYHGNISNQNAIKDIIIKSSDVLINYKKIDEINFTFTLDKLFVELNNIIFCKNCDSEKNLLCKNSSDFVLFLIVNSNEDILQRILKYLLLSEGYPGDIINNDFFDLQINND